MTELLYFACILNQSIMIDSFRKYLNEEQDPKAVEKVFGIIKDLLTPGEEIRYIAVQKKPAVNISPDSVVLTTKRIIFCRPKSLGLTMDFKDILWKDVAECHMKEAILGAEFTVNPVKGQQERIDYLPKVQARKLYQVAQEKEEEQAEFRRQRELEEKRAAAGNVVMTSNVPAPQQETPKADDAFESLQKLKTLFERGLITQQEYDNKKAEILSRF
jgi:hypothetical protein